MTITFLASLPKPLVTKSVTLFGMAFFLNFRYKGRTASMYVMAARAFTPAATVLKLSIKYTKENLKPEILINKCK